ncbi:hypothetical protein KC367_g3749 [Hortaea werneckii]|nr:hypothetical protein KC342_g1963 [Hortaea werneckii]KAI7105506.1 hypothetical protein KC339_g3769 [Hortaea werneckii]KAI7225126.1 hypothetical protein KC365_g10170 [Hortaea werneckii]KAI7315328.1 hypothetical protein KC340_g9027 [Hortaea werneckii]KAI7398072.1 hypothetical protein KC328_g4628 [Hortaea werneckii]
METSLSALPEELIVRISDQVSVDSLVHFALACRITYRCAKPRLVANQHYEEQEQMAQHDRLPLTVPCLLRKIFNEPDASSFHWHSLDVWGNRPGSDVLDSDEGREMRGPDWPDPAEDHSHLDSSFFTPAELDFYAYCMRSKLFLDPDQTQEWMSKVREGWDEPLKALLVALSPGLRRLNYIAELMEFPIEHPLGFLTEAISCIYHAPNAIWPPGFMALRRVSVGTASNIRHASDGFSTAPSEVASLLLLPSIKVLNLTALKDEDPVSDFHLPSSSSSVEALTFRFCEMGSEAHEKLLLAPRGLRRLRCIDSAGFTRSLTGQLAQQYARTLEVLIVYGQDSTVDNTCLKEFENLAFLDGVESSSLATCATHSSASSEPLCGCASIDLRSILPLSLQQLTIRDSSLKNIQKGAQECLLRDAAAELAEDERFEHLRELCFWNVDLGGECDEAVMRIKSRGISLRQNGREGGEILEDDYLERRKAALGNYAELETDPICKDGYLDDLQGINQVGVHA